MILPRLKQQQVGQPLLGRLPPRPSELVDHGPEPSHAIEKVVVLVRLEHFGLQLRLQPQLRLVHIPRGMFVPSLIFVDDYESVGVLVEGVFKLVDETV